MQAQLNIDNYFVDDLVMKANPKPPNVREKQSVIGVDFDIKSKHGDPLSYAIFMTLSVNGKDEELENAEYRIALRIAGYFHFEKETPKEMIGKLIAPNGLAMLYGVARGVVAQATANGRHGKFVLPSLNFIEIIQKKAKGAEKKKTVTKKEK